MVIERITSRGQLLNYAFTQDALAANQSNVQLVHQDGLVAVDGISMPFAGELVALGWNTSAAATAGTITIGYTNGGTEVAATTQTATTGVAGYQVFQRGAVPFAAGDKIGAEITTDGSWDGTTADLVVYLYVLVYLEGI